MSKFLSDDVDCAGAPKAALVPTEVIVYFRTKHWDKQLQPIIM